MGFVQGEYTQSSASGNNNGGTLTVTLSNVVAGNSIVVLLTGQDVNISGYTINTLTVTDSAGNTYTSPGIAGGTSGLYASMSYSLNVPAAGSLTITGHWTVSGASPAAVSIFAAEYSGLGPYDSYNVSGGAITLNPGANTNILTAMTEKTTTDIAVVGAVLNAGIAVQFPQIGLTAWGTMRVNHAGYLNYIGGSGTAGISFEDYTATAASPSAGNYGFNATNYSGVQETDYWLVYGLTFIPMLTGVANGSSTATATSAAIKQSVGSAAGSSTAGAVAPIPLVGNAHGDSTAMAYSPTSWWPLWIPTAITSTVAAKNTCQLTEIIDNNYWAGNEISVTVMYAASMMIHSLGYTALALPGAIVSVLRMVDDGVNAGPPTFEATAANLIGDVPWSFAFPFTISSTFHRTFIVSAEISKFKISICNPSGVSVTATVKRKPFMLPFKPNTNPSFYMYKRNTVQAQQLSLAPSNQCFIGAGCTDLIIKTNRTDPDGKWDNCYLCFTSGACKGIIKKIAAYQNGVITLNSKLNIVPIAGDSALITEQ